MKIYTDFEAKQNYSMVLNTALVEDIIILKEDAADKN
jgi:hypothetical protein